LEVDLKIKSEAMEFLLGNSEEAPSTETFFVDVVLSATLRFLATYFSFFPGACF
jgi:hypothetical protein